MLEEQARRLGIWDAIHMPGYIGGISSLISEFDVFAIPSRTEGLPLVLLEALFAGTPVAATRVGDMPEVLANCDSGACVDPGDATSFANRISELLVQESGTSRTKAAATKAKVLYSTVTMASGYQRIYEDLLRAP